jgi:nicotinate-nucleotide--dimethylbenzimidazole phosphoribosyltransferase
MSSLKENISPLLKWTLEPVASISKDCQEHAVARQKVLTKPQGSLGQLETIAITLAGWQHSQTPAIKKPYISIFAADHGVASDGVSAFPQVVTMEMIKNFSRGGAAVSVLAQSHGASFEVVNCGTIEPMEPLEKVINQPVACGTKNFFNEAAMNIEELERAMKLGFDAIDRAQQDGADIFIAGDMGIGNTSSATALGCVLTHADASILTGPGTGLDESGVNAKAEKIRAALALHNVAADDVFACLATFGGFEIAAMTGAYIRAAQVGMGILVDGFISTAAALCAVALNPEVRQWMLFAHSSAEPGHKHMLAALNATPLLVLGMRLGEGSGAAIVLPIVKSACDLHNKMATFEQADVSDKEI